MNRHCQEYILRASTGAELGCRNELRGDNQATPWVVYTNAGSPQEATVMTCGFSVEYGDGEENWTPDIPLQYGLVWIDLVFGNAGGRHECSIDARNGTLISVPANALQARISFQGREENPDELPIKFTVVGSIVEGTRGGIFAPTFTSGQFVLQPLSDTIIRVPPFASKLLIYSDSADAYTGTYQFLGGPQASDVAFNAASTFVNPNAGNGSGLQVPGAARYLRMRASGESTPTVWPTWLLDL